MCRGRKLSLNPVSVVDVRAAVAGQGNAEVARIGFDRSDGAPARPKIVPMTRDGEYVVLMRILKEEAELEVW